MPNPKDMQRYQQMLDELADKYPELEDPIASLEDAMMESMESETPEEDTAEGPEGEAMETEAPAEGEEEMPMPKMPKKNPFPEQDEEETDEGY